MSDELLLKDASVQQLKDTLRDKQEAIDALHEWMQTIPGKLIRNGHLTEWLRVKKVSQDGIHGHRFIVGHACGFAARFGSREIKFNTEYFIHEHNLLGQKWHVVPIEDIQFAINEASSVIRSAMTQQEEL